ncbi:Uu.00g004900.m01.CDS01 [Anthostomella pinea]|uniref:Uu.00g004900.m01.CDS01 n=1 Tax=Anthostomella pinea TaxID=933095 RepID=A0AAI8YIU7_9PEZI|nr:Uu.00g004900.m01.CDS01 [Anthostomella pinea]
METAVNPDLNIGFVTSAQHPPRHCGPCCGSGPPASSVSTAEQRCIPGRGTLRRCRSGLRG